MAEQAHVSVIGLARGEEGLKRVVAGDDETGEVGEELSANVEEDGEEVESSYTEDEVDLGDRGRLLKLVEVAILGELQVRMLAEAQAGLDMYSTVDIVVSGSSPVEGQCATYLLVELRDLVLGAVLERHFVC